MKDRSAVVSGFPARSQVLEHLVHSAHCLSTARGGGGVPVCYSSNTHKTSDLGYASDPTCPIVHRSGSTCPQEWEHMPPLFITYLCSVLPMLLKHPRLCIWELIGVPFLDNTVTHHGTQHSTVLSIGFSDTDFPTDTWLSEEPEIEVLK